MQKIFFCLLAVACLLRGRAGGQVLPDTAAGSFVQQAPAVRDSLPADTAGAAVLLLPAALRDTADTAAVKKQPFQPVPKKAALYSGIFPGLGQAYNRQYWKLPIIYAGAGIAGYFIVTNLDRYRTYRKAYIARLGREPDDYPYLSDGDLRLVQETYKRRLDMTVLFTALGYTAQIIDALAAAHLRNFDISEDISMRLGPVATPGGGLGVGLAVHFQ